MWERDSLKLSFVCKDTKCILPHIMWSVFNVKVHSISTGQATRYDGMWWPTAGAPNSHPIQPNYRTKLPALATLSLSSRICVLINSTPHWLLEFLINPASWWSFTVISKITILNKVIYNLTVSLTKLLHGPIKLPNIASFSFDYFSLACIFNSFASGAAEQSKIRNTSILHPA